MIKTNLKVLTEKEMSQISGGRWMLVKGKWIWISAKEENDIEYVDNTNSIQRRSLEF